MTITEYKKRVRELFENGEPTEAQWNEMTDAVLNASEGEIHIFTEEIDEAVEYDDDDEESHTP